MQVDPDSLLDLLPDVVVVMEPDSEITYANAAASRLLGWTNGELIGRSAFDFVHPDEQAEAIVLIAEQLSDQTTTRRHHVELARRDGGYVKFEMLVVMDQTAGGRFVLVLRDVSESAEVQKRLHRSDEQLRALTENVPDGVARFDDRARLVFESRRFSEMAVANPELVDIWTAHASGVLASGELLDVEHAIAKESRWVAARFVPERDTDGSVTHVLLIASDVTDRKANEIRLLHAAHHDGLTGLLTRQRFRELAERALASPASPDQRSRDGGAALALVFVDLDGFKAVNDRYGHAAGDTVLAVVADRLTQLVRPHDIVARFGGDEFVMLCHGVHPHEVHRIAERIAAAVAEPILDLTTGAAICVGASVGVAIADEIGATLDRLIELADRAMYRVKGATR